MGSEKQPLKRLAVMMFKPRDKKPYVFNGKPLKNLQDLKDYLVAFTGKEALWVASWMEYLGDRKTAECIRRKPENFKNTVLMRYKELKPYL
jgi:hypothetical protein